MEVYLRYQASIDDVASKLRDALNLPSTNKTLHQAEQKREGANYGGFYYLFECLGATLILLENFGEVEVPERPDYRYYLLVVTNSGEKADRIFADQICRVLQEAGVICEVDALTY